MPPVEAVAVGDTAVDGAAELPLLQLPRRRTVTDHRSLELRD